MSQFRDTAPKKKAKNHPSKNLKSRLARAATTVKSDDSVNLQGGKK